MEKINNFCSNLSSQTINIIKFICCIGVVCLHTSYKAIPVGTNDLCVPGGGWQTFVALLQQLLTICVPVFFFFSGYLFFLNWGGYNIKWFAGKFRKRVKSLLVPYLVGNLLVCISFILSNYLFSSFMGAGNNYRMNMSPTDWLLIFWNPLGNPVLWFVRDLMVVILLTPIIIPLLQKVPYIILPILSVGWLFGLWPSGYSGFSSVSFCFFYVGAYFSIRKVDIVDKVSKNRYGSAIFMVLFVTLWLYCALFSDNEILAKMMIIFGSVSLISISRYAAKTKLSSFNASFWLPASFFVYVYHHIVHIPVKKFLYVMIHPTMPFMNYVIFIVTVLFVIYFLAGIYYLMKKAFPKYVWIFTGR